MIRGLIYLALLVGFIFLVFSKGDKDERSVAIALLVASIASFFAVIIEGRYFNGINIGMFTVDIVFLLYLVYISLFSDKYWPMWVSSLQLLNSAIHITILLIPETVPQAYALSQGIWSYIQMLIISLSILRAQHIKISTDRSYVK